MSLGIQSEEEKSQIEDDAAVIMVLWKLFSVRPVIIKNEYQTLIKQIWNCDLQIELFRTWNTHLINRKRKFLNQQRINILDRRIQQHEKGTLRDRTKVIDWPSANQIIHFYCWVNPSHSFSLSHYWQVWRSNTQEFFLSGI